MSIIIKKNSYTNNENFIGNKVIYRPNNNNLAKTLILLYNSANSFEEFVEANYFIYLVKLLIIFPISILFQCFNCAYRILAFSFVCNDISLEISNNTNYSISGHAN